MSRTEKRAYIQAVRPRYQRSSREEKGSILREVSLTLGCHRKSAQRLLGDTQPLGGKKKQSKAKKGTRIGRPPRVQAEDLEVLKQVYIASRYACGRRLVQLLPHWLGYVRRRGVRVSLEQQQRLESFSSATLDRHLRPLRRALGIKGRSGTKPGSLLRTHIPVRSGPWDVCKPGFLEMDTVAHCGSSIKGPFLWSLTTTDIHSTWTEIRGVWNKSATDVVAALQDIDEHLPFTIAGFDSDNGSEFINKTVIRYVQNHPDKPLMTRGRPYKKNDGAHVEQKNWTHVRSLLGYARIDTKSILKDLNDLYRNEMSWYNNLFNVHMKLVSKQRVGSKIRRKYDTPKTPLQRLIQSGHGDPKMMAHYQQLQKDLNPFELFDTIESKIKEIMFRAAAASVTAQK